MSDDEERPVTLDGGNWPERATKNGTKYIQGWFGPLRFTLFESKYPDKWGNKQWFCKVANTPKKGGDERRDEGGERKPW